MNYSSIEEMIQVYLRAISDSRLVLGIIGLSIAILTLFLAVTWPKSYTASSTIYADNTNLLRPLMAGDAVLPSNMVDQARMAQDILFSNEYSDLILESAGFDVADLSLSEKDRLIIEVEGATSITNEGRGAARLVRISHTDPDPVKAFRVVQRYASIFIEQAALSEQEDSRAAFQFIETQVLSYQEKLQTSEGRLSTFKSENNLGTLANANNRIAGYRADIERLELSLSQFDRQIELVEAQLAGELVVSRDLSQINAISNRINSLQMTLDTLRSRFHDTYPDVVQIKNQISDLQEILASGDTSGFSAPEQLAQEGVTTLQNELRSRLSNLQTEREATTSQIDGIATLLLAEESRARRINQTEAELAELTRDYNVTQDFYNTMLQRLENARVSMHLNDEQQGITFKIQESAAIPTQPDGFSFSQLMIGSLLFAIGGPLALMVAVVEVDPRIRSESSWSNDWPPILATVPKYDKRSRWWQSNILFLTILALIGVGIYGVTGYLYLEGYFVS